MELLEAIHTRRSVRIYSDKKILKEDLKKIIDAGRWAPSASNQQGWRFIEVEDPKLKREMINAGAASFLENAPTGILVLYNNQTDNPEYLDYVQSGAACIQNMILAAHALGVGTCWICHLPRKEELRRMFSIPKHYDPIAYIAMGYAQRGPKAKDRKGNIDDLIFHNKSSAIREMPGSTVKLHVKRMMKKTFNSLPFRKYLVKESD